MPLSCYVPSQIIPKSRVVHLADKQILKRHILRYPKIIVSKDHAGGGWGGGSVPGPWTRRTRFRFGCAFSVLFLSFFCPFSSQRLRFVHTLSLTLNETLKWLSSLPIFICRNHSGDDSVADRYIYIISLVPPPRPSLFPVPNKPYGFCGR